MKRSVSRVLGMALCISAFMAFSNLTPTAFANGTKDAGQKPLVLSCGSGTVGGSFYIMAAAVSTVVTREVPGVQLVTQTTSGSGEAYVGVVQKDYEVCITNADFGYIGAHGGDPAQPAYVAGPNVRTWMVIEPTPYLMAARANNTKVRAFEDLIKPGLKVGANTLSSGSNVLVGYVVEALGGKMSDIDQYPAGHDQTCTALKDGNIDIATTFAGQLSSPNAAYQELTATTDINWFVIPPKIRDEINAKYPYFRKVVIQPGWTPKITEPYETLGVHGIFLIDKDVPEEVVYQMTKAVFEHVDELGMAFPALKVLGKDTAAVGATCEIHPGALRYYQENGFKIEVDR